jgi:hypothetical protein
VQSLSKAESTVQEVASLSIRIWEWVVDKGGDYAPSGVCGERGRAMERLSRTLIEVGEPMSGRVVPLCLVDDKYGYSYVRLPSYYKADCRKGIIRWTKS